MRAPDRTIALPTRPDQALVYRLCGDRNRCTRIRNFANAPGFRKPILHACAPTASPVAVSATYAITIRTLSSSTLRGFLPVYPARP